jgi:hypothetical protein
MLPGDNMLDMKRQDIVSLMDATVFTAVARPGPDLRPGRGFHLRRGGLRQQRAGLLLQYGEHLHGLDRGVVLGGFVRRQQALVTPLY